MQALTTPKRFKTFLDESTSTESPIAFYEDYERICTESPYTVLELEERSLPSQQELFQADKKYESQIAILET